MDMYLKFTDEAEATAVLFTQEPTEWDNSGDEPVATAWEPRANYANIDTLGVIYKPVGEFNEETGQASEALPGWHVNVRVVEGEDAEALEAFAVTPAQPRRVWA